VQLIVHQLCFNKVIKLLMLLKKMYSRELVAYTCNLSNSGSRQRSEGLLFESSLSKWSARPYLKNTRLKKDWWSGSSSTAPA
jgi:hypothetical protein